jgi:hypothetical protein
LPGVFTDFLHNGAVSLPLFDTRAALIPCVGQLSSQTEADIVGDIYFLGMFFVFGLLYWGLMVLCQKLAGGES